MKLTDTEYCRAFAFVELLKLTLARDGQPMPTDDQELPSLAIRKTPTGEIDPIKEIQRGTCINASIFAQQNFPHVVFEPWEYMDGVNASKYSEAEAYEDENGNGEREPTAEELAAITI